VGRRYVMGRNEFALGVLVGSLAGLALGYVIKRAASQETDDLASPETIDLTPALERRNALAATVGETAGVAE
jgi:hypothetical protein